MHKRESLRHALAPPCDDSDVIKSLSRTPRSGGSIGRKNKRFAFVSTRIGIRRSTSRRRRNSNRRRNSISRRSSGMYGVDSNDVSADRRKRQDSDGFTPNKDAVPNFLQRKIPPSIRRSKSTKLSAGKENRPMDMNALMAHGGPPKPEMDLPFFMPSIEQPDALDLSSAPTDYDGAIVRPLHHSILDKDFCFEVVTSTGDSRCFCCNSAGEREAWIEKIKRSINPNLDNSRRIEHQLTLFVQEAKGLPTKKRYFCEICLDRKLCARTTSKLKMDSSVLWGEHFEFTSMPEIEDITVHLYKDSDKKKKKDKDYIGLVNLPVRLLVNQQTLEKWYTLSTPSGNSKGKSGEVLAIRIKARFLSTRVLPTECYKIFAEHVSANYLEICRALGTQLSVAKKDEFARIMVNVMFGTGSIKEYMGDVVLDEVDKVEEESLIFRENTIGTKSVEAFLRLVGMKYLHDTLGDFISALFRMEEDCEVDGSRLPPHASLDVNQENLKMSCEIALSKITSSVNIFPSELREVMALWRNHCESNNRPRIANRLVTASLFLRLLCPSILNPSLFGLAKEIPDPKTSRTLTLIAKVIQNLANRSRFGNKEEYMQFMDVFVREKWDAMGEFISNVSDPQIPALCKGFEGFIDLGKEFAKLHAFFVEVIPTLDQSTIDKLGNLPSYLHTISESLASPNVPDTHRRVSNDPYLVKISEDAALAGSDALAPPGSSSTPMIGRKFMGGASMGDLREVTNGQMDGFGNGYSPHHASHLSIPVSSSMNNNNSIGWPLSSTENLLNDQALMFANPAHKYQPHSGYSAAKNVPQQYKKNPPKPHLETVFSTETRTYSMSPTQHRRARIYLEPSTPPSVESDGSRSNESSLSSRQSSTTTSNSTEKSGNTPKKELSDEEMLMSAQSVSSAPVLSAHLKKGLQFQNRVKNDPNPNKPLPKPRSSLGGADRKFSVPCLPSQNMGYNVQGRRGSADVYKTTVDSPSLHLAHNEHDAILELNEGNSPSNERRHRQNDSISHTKDQNGFVTAPVAAVKSRVVVATSNAARIKTSRHALAATQQKPLYVPVNQGRRSSNHKIPTQGKPPEPQQNPSLPPTTPEGPMSPEARTAQWILNNVATPNKEVKDDTHAVLTPKDYEDRIIRLETEVERLRLSVTEGRDAQRNLEAKEHAWAEKLRRAQRAVELLNASEDKLKKQKEEREGKVREISERMKQSDMDHRRERTELKALIESKEGLVREQSDRILRLEEANLRLVATIKRLRARESPNDVIDFIDDEQKRHNDVKNGEFCLHGLSSGSSSSSV